MRVNRDEVVNVRRVNVNVGESEVVDLVCGKVAEELGLDKVVAANHLKVEFSDNHSAYVRGEVPLTHEQQLEALGLTPSEPVETDGAAIAEGLPGQLDCVDERGRPAGPQSADVRPEAGTVVALRIAVMKRDSRLREIRAVVDDQDLVGERARDLIRRLCDSVLKDEAFTPLLAVERYHIKLVGKLQNDGELTEADLYSARDSAVQEYTAEVGRTTLVEGQVLQHDVDAEDRRQLEAKLARIRELEQANADAGTWGAAVGARAEELRELCAQVSTLRQRLATSDSATFREELSARQVADEAFSRNTAEALDKVALKLDTSSVSEAATRTSEAFDSLRRLREDGVVGVGGSGGGGGSNKSFVEVDGRGPVTYRVVFPGGGVPLEAAVQSARGLLETVEKLRAVVGDLSTPEGQAKLREMVRKTVEGARQSVEKLGPAVGDDLGVQVGTGEYAPGAVPLVPRQETPAQPIVSHDALYQARRRLTEMLEDAGSQGGIRGHAWHKTEDLRYVVALLGGEAGTSLSSPAETWAGLVEEKPESRSAAAQERRRTLLKLADRLLQEVLLANSGISQEVRLVLCDVEQELRRMSR